MNCEDSETLFERSDGRRATRAADGRDNLIWPRSNHEYRKQFFSPRVTEGWNRLPNSVKAAKSISSFKRLYRRHIGDPEAPATTDQGGR